MMQKNVEKLGIVYSKEFVEKFKKAVIKTYNYETYMDFIVIPFLWEKTLSYMSILSYTDRQKDDIKDLLELSKDNEYQIRVLNFEYNDFKKFDTVTMRINAKNRTIDDLCENFSHSKKRYIKKSLNSGITYDIGNSDILIDRFYTIFTKTMHRLGTPPHKKELFYNLRDELETEFIVYYYNNEIVGGVCFLIDEEIIIGEWLAVSEKYKKERIGEFMLYIFLKESVKYNKEIIDFGRSGYESGTYQFKERFGFYPVKIDMISSEKEDIYTKYSLASDIWKKLPLSVVNFIGPKLAKYLKEY
jgi:hypothetical protein